MKDNIKDFFKSNPNVEKLFITSDGQQFAVRNHAENHARSLQGKKVAEYENGAYEPDEQAKALKDSQVQFDEAEKQRAAEIKKQTDAEAAAKAAEKKAAAEAKAEAEAQSPAATEAKPKKNRGS